MAGLLAEPQKAAILLSAALTLPTKMKKKSAITKQNNIFFI